MDLYCPNCGRLTLVRSNDSTFYRCDNCRAKLCIIDLAFKPPFVDALGIFNSTCQMDDQLRGIVNQVVPLSDKGVTL